MFILCEGKGLVEGFAFANYFKERPAYAGMNYTLISTSTPLGNSNFMSASMVFEDEL